MSVSAADASHARALVEEPRPRAGAALWLRTVLMALQIFAIIASFTLTRAVRDALFLSQFRMASLAYVSLVLAVLAGIAVSLHQRFVAERFSRGDAAVITLLGVSVSLAALWLALEAHLRWVPWVLYLWSGIFGLFLVAQFWIMALEVFDPREAKRTYAFLAAGASLGGIAGGTLAHGLTRTLGESGPLLLVAGVLALCAALARWTWSMRPPERADSAPSASPSPHLLDSVRALRSSPLLRATAAVLLCSIVAGTLLDWQVKAVVKAHYHSDREAMTACFGRILALGSVLALLLQSVTSALLRRAGVAAGLLVLPAVALGGALLFLGHGAMGLSLLGAAVMAKSAENGVRNSVDKAALELLYMPLQGRVRAAGKGLVDTVVDRLGGAITAVLWLGLQGVVEIETPGRVAYASYAVLGIVGLWGMLALRARGHYLGAFRRALARLELRPERLAGPLADAAQRGALMEALASPRPAEVLLALDLMADPANGPVALSLAAPLAHPHETVRARALEVLTARREGEDSALPLLGDPSPAVRVAAVRWLLAVGPARAGTVRSPAAWRWVQLARLPDGERGRALGALARNPDPSERAAAAVLAAGTGDSALLAALRDDEHPLVARAAVAAVASRGEAADVPFLLQATTRRATRTQAVEGLARVGSLAALGASLQAEELSAPVRGAVAEALARTLRPEAVAPLAAAATSARGELRGRMLKALEALKRDTGAGPALPWIVAEVEREVTGLATLAAVGTRLEREGDWAVQPVTALLVRATSEAIDAGLERLFRLLALAATPTAMRDAWLSLRDADPRGRATCVEYLDNVLPAALRALVVPIVEPTTARGRRAALLGSGRVPLPGARGEALMLLLQSEQGWLRALAAAAWLDQGGARAALPRRDAEDDPRVQEVLASLD
jgi:AAA family ATP:ADP antiporter